MLSFTSNSKGPHEIHRQVPDRSWLTMAAITALICATLLAGWEWRVRSMGYVPDYDDTPALWVPLRQAAKGAKRDQIVLVGASRTLFDLDLDVIQQATGGKRPLQLATVGSNAMMIFNDLAKDETFAGTVIMGVVPGLISVPMHMAIPPNENPKRYIRRYESWGPAQQWERTLSLWVQKQFAFIQQEDLTLKELTRRLPLPPRQGAKTPPPTPPHFSQIDIDRRTRMTVSAEGNTALMARIQKGWLRLFSPPPKPPVFTDAVWAKMGADAWKATLAQAKANVAAIRRRGGRVIFVNHPSSGELLKLEKRVTPRKKIWDRLIAETGAPGIHFEDYEELADFVCPEWSHLSATDSIKYTRRLMAILKEEGLL